MKAKNIKLFFILTSSLFLTNCLSTSSYKTAKALGKTPSGKGQMQIVTAVNYLPSQDYGYFLGALQPEYMFRAALAPELIDFGFKLAGGIVFGDLKIQFIRGPLNIAVDFEAGTSINDPISNTYHLSQLKPGLLITLDLAPGFSLTLAPSAIFWKESSTQDQYGYTTYRHSGLLYGGALTLDLGKNFGIMPEVTYFFDPSSGETVTSFGLGLRLGGIAHRNKNNQSKEDETPGSDLDGLAD